MVNCVESDAILSCFFGIASFVANSKFRNSYKIFFLKWSIVIHTKCWSFDFCGVFLKYSFTGKRSSVVHEMNFSSFGIISVLDEFLQDTRIARIIL